MRNMALLIDTNVILNYITNRDDPYLEQSVEVVRCCVDGRCTGYIAFHALSTLWYVLKDFEDSEIPAITPADILEMVNRT